MGPSSSSRTLASWVRRLGSPDPTTVEAAKEALAAAGNKTIPLLLGLLDGDDDPARLRALSLLSLLGSPRAAAPVAALLHDPSPLIRQRAAGTLARIPSARSVPALTRLLEREPQTRVRAVAVHSLTRLVQTGHEDALPALLGLLADPEEAPSVRAAALDTIPWMISGEDDGRARAILRRFARDDEPMVARKAGRMLKQGLRTHLAPWAITQLLADLGTRRLSVWRRALTLLSRAGGTVVEPLLEALLSRPADKTYARRCALVLRGLSPRILSRIGPYLDSVDEAIPLLVLVEVAEDAGSRPLLARVAALIGRLAAGPEANGPDGFDLVRQRAHAALASSGSRMGAQDLVVLLEDRRFPIRGELIDAARMIGTRQEFPALLRAYRRSRGMTRLAIRDVVLTVARREKIRRTDRALAQLDESERRAAREILGLPRNGSSKTTRVGRAKIDSLRSPLLP